MTRPNLAILLVEPHMVTRQLYARELGRTWRVIACDDKPTALKYVYDPAIVAIVLEPALGDGDGWAVLAAIRSTPALQHLPVIICSAVDDRRRGIEMGATSYLIKPTPPRELELVLHQALTGEGISGSI